MPEIKLKPIDLVMAPGITVGCPKCSFFLKVLQKDLEEILAGVWGPVNCPRCSARLNEAISDAAVGLPDFHSSDL